MFNPRAHRSILAPCVNEKHFYIRAWWISMSSTQRTIGGKFFITAIAWIISAALVFGQEVIYLTSNGKITFVSNAPLEMITATSDKMEGVIDANEMSFAFVVNIGTFKGFNNGLQQQHFYENYLETDKYPEATFSGKIIEHVDLRKAGTYMVRAKGQLNIHGRVKERIIRVELISSGTTIRARTVFYVPLIDHQIEVPRIVNQKIAQEIEVTVEALLSLSGKP
jgi:hypothetical protein